MCLSEAQACILVLGALKARRQIIDPLALCGAAMIALCRGRGDCHPSWKSSLVESGIKVSGKLA